MVLKLFTIFIAIGRQYAISCGFTFLIAIAIAIAIGRMTEIRAPYKAHFLELEV
jgi:hypothetical protein